MIETKDRFSDKFVASGRPEYSHFCFPIKKLGFWLIGRLRSRISQTLGGPNMGVGANCEESGRYIGRAMSHSASPTIRQVARSSGILAGVESRSF